MTKNGFKNSWYPLYALVIFAALFGVLVLVHWRTMVKCQVWKLGVLKCDCEEHQLGYDVYRSDLFDFIHHNNNPKWPPDSFKRFDLKEFHRIEVSSCREISEIGELALYWFKKLRELTFNFNSISTLKKNSLSGLKHLTDLRITDNKISVIDERALDEMEELEILHLDRNQLNVFMWRWLNKPLNLREISLSSNGMEKWTGFQAVASEPIGGIRVLSSIRSINVGNNHLTEITSGLFAIAPNLEYLNVENNRIKFIGIHVFDNAKYLQILIIRGNLLQTPDPQWFALIKKQIEIDWTGNPWECGEETLRNMGLYGKSNLKNAVTTPVKIPPIVCQTPELVKGKRLDNALAGCIQSNFRSCIVETSRPSQPSLSIPWTIILVFVTAAVSVCATAAIYKLCKRFNSHRWYGGPARPLGMTARAEPSGYADSNSHDSISGIFIPDDDSEMSLEDFISPEDLGRENILSLPATTNEAQSRNDPMHDCSPSHDNANDDRNREPSSSSSEAIPPVDTRDTSTPAGIEQLYQTLTNVKRNKTFPEERGIALGNVTLGNNDRSSKFRRPESPSCTIIATDVCEGSVDRNIQYSVATQNVGSLKNAIDHSPLLHSSAREQQREVSSGAEVRTACDLVGCSVSDSRPCEEQSFRANNRSKGSTPMQDDAVCRQVAKFTGWNRNQNTTIPYHNKTTSFHADQIKALSGVDQSLPRTRSAPEIVHDFASVVNFLNKGPEDNTNEIVAQRDNERFPDSVSGDKELSSFVVTECPNSFNSDSLSCTLKKMDSRTEESLSIDVSASGPQQNCEKIPVMDAKNSQNHSNELAMRLDSKSQNKYFPVYDSNVSSFDPTRDPDVRFTAKGNNPRDFATHNLSQSDKTIPVVTNDSAPRPTKLFHSWHDAQSNDTRSKFLASSRGNELSNLSSDESYNLLPHNSGSVSGNNGSQYSFHTVPFDSDNFSRGSSAPGLLHSHHSGGSRNSDFNEFSGPDSFHTASLHSNWSSSAAESPHFQHAAGSNDIVYPQSLDLDSAYHSPSLVVLAPD